MISAALFGKRRNIAPPTPDSVRTHLQRILASEPFARSERHRRFLSFVVEETLQDHKDALKETVIAGEVFGRDSSFDPRVDSIVRLEAGRLRTRLERYYSTEGLAESVAIDLPKGSYVPVFRARAVPAAGAERLITPRMRILLTCGLAALLGVAAWWALTARMDTPRSLAILPFLDLSEDHGNQHVADGVVEDLTTDFSRMPGLRIASRTSAFQFRGKSQDVRRIGRELRAQAVIEGSVRRQGDRVRVTVQLIETSTGYHRWSNSYDCDLADLWNTEHEIERDAGAALGIRYVEIKRAHLPPAAAREEYWRGHFILTDYKRWAESTPFFEHAVALDPQYAAAWASLAASYAYKAYLFEAPPETEVPRALEAAHRAIQLDEASAAEAYLALAMVGCSHRRDWKAAESAYRRAIEINPDSALTRLTFAGSLADRNRTEEALAQVALARQMDPTSFRSAVTGEATVLYFAGRYDEAIRVARRHLDMDPSLTSARFALAICYAASGRLTEAIDNFRRLLSEGVVSFPVMGRLGNALVRAGRVKDAAEVIARIDAMEKHEPAGTPLVARAQIALAFGDRTRAIAYLEQAAELAIPDINHLGVDPIWDPIRGDPMFQTLCTRLELPNRMSARNSTAGVPIRQPELAGSGDVRAAGAHVHGVERLAGGHK